MKKIISCLTVLVMLFTMTAIANAAPVSEVPTVVDTDINIRFSGASSYSNSVSVSKKDSEAFPTLDVIASLDMETVRNVSKTVAHYSSFETLKANGYVTADIKVTVEYPSSLTIADDLAKFGGAADPAFTESIYTETGRTMTPGANKNTLVITLTGESSLKALYDDVSSGANKLMGDITLEALNIAVPDYGKYTFQGTIECTVSIHANEEDKNNKKVYNGHTYTFKSIQKAGGDDSNTSGEIISATAKVNEYSSVGQGSSSGGSVTKISVTPTVTPGKIPAGTEVGFVPSISTGKVYYTTDGTDPSVTADGKLEGTTKLYTDTIPVNEDTTFKVIAVTANGKTKSSVLTAAYTVVGVDVEISLNSGIVKLGTEVELTTKTGKDIFYTTDGNDPTFDADGNPTGSTKKYTDPIVIDKDMTIKAVAVDEDGYPSVIASEIYTIAPELIGEHIAYIKGYPSEDGSAVGEFRPEMPITRAEVAKIFSRITIKKMDVETTAKSSFSDVPEDAWYYSAVAFMEQAGIVKGYEDGTFRPDNYITRAEFATIASRYDKLENIDENIFSDVTTLHWAYQMVNSASKKGWVKGYEDGTFKPNDNIKRCEVVTVVNRMLGRKAEEEFKNADLSKFIIFPDTQNVNMHWAFYEIVESANDHDYK